jgi:oligogalacturonide transporter
MKLEDGEGRLSHATRIGYGLGDLFGGGSTTIINMYYLLFLVDIVGIAPRFAGLAFLVSKMWDALSDPFMGIITDNTRSRFGRRRVYFLAGIFLIFISFLVMWIPPPLEREMLRFFWVLLTYLIFSTVYTMVWVPYNAIAAELTDNYHERTKLSTYRMLFSNLAGILGGTLPLDLFVNGLFKGDPKTGFFMMAFCFGLFFSLPYIVTFLTCRENPEFMKLPKTRVGNLKNFFANTFVEPFKLKPFRMVVMMYLFGFMGQDAVMGLAVYLMTYLLKIPSMMTLLIPVYAALLFAVPSVQGLSKRIGKRRTYMLAVLLWLIALSLIPFMNENSPRFLIYLFAVFFGLGLAGVQVMVFASFPDVPDADQFLNGRRREGLFSGIFAFLRKTGSAFTLFLIGVLLDLSGYLPPVEGLVQVQTELFLTRLTFIVVGLPGIYLFIAFFAAKAYPLTRARLETISEVLKLRKNGLPLSPALAEKERELKEVLGGELSNHAEKE